MIFRSKEKLSRKLRWAAGDGDLSRVRALQKQGGDIRSNNDWALCSAAQEGHLDMVKYCVAQGCDIRAENDAALRLAAARGHLDVVKYCVAQGGDIRAQDDYALREAAENRHLDVVKYCVEQGGDIRAKNDYALRRAVWWGRLDIVKYCVEQGCDIRRNNDWALRRAAESFHRDVVKYCVEQGCDINVLGFEEKQKYPDIFGVDQQASPYRLVNDYTVLREEGNLPSFGKLFKIFDFSAQTVTSVIDNNPSRPLLFSNFRNNKREIFEAYDWLKQQGKHPYPPFGKEPRRIQRRNTPGNN